MDNLEQVGLNIPLRFIFKPSYSPHCINTDVGCKLLDELRLMIEKRLELNFWRKLWHHAPTSIFVFAGGLFTHAYFNQPDNLPSPAVSRTGLLITAIVFYIVAIPVYLYLETKLKFISLPILIDKTEFIERLLKKAETERWGLVSEFDANAKRLEFRKSYFGTSDSEVTIDIEDKVIFINIRGRYPIDKKILREIKSIVA